MNITELSYVLVEISFNREPTAEQMGIVGSKLGTPAI